MKQILLLALLLYILFFPGPAIEAASFGLTLWYDRLLPTLLPFAILSYIFVETRLLHRLIPKGPARIYPLTAGFLFGFPLGSKITAHLVAEGRMDHEEGRRLFALCNNISPLFVSGFILHTTFRRPQLTAVTLAILYLPPLFLLLCQRRKREIPRTQAREQKISLELIDAGIMSGFETLTKLGGYIMLFAIIAQMTNLLPLPNPYLRCLLTGMTEITNGIAVIAKSPLPFPHQYLLMIFCTAFGGLSGVAQTASMTREAGFSILYYVKIKFLLGLASLALGILIFPLL